MNGFIIQRKQRKRAITANPIKTVRTGKVIRCEAIRQRLELSYLDKIDRQRAQRLERLNNRMQ